MILLIIVIALMLVVAFIAYGKKIGSDKEKSKLIFKLFKQLRAKYPEDELIDVYIAVHSIYFKTLFWDHTYISIANKYLLEHQKDKLDLKGLAIYILSKEKPINEEHYSSTDKYYDAKDKRVKDINDAYGDIFGSE